MMPNLQQILHTPCPDLNPHPMDSNSESMHIANIKHITYLCKLLTNNSQFAMISTFYAVNEVHMPLPR